ncbi:MAG: hypothetical protein PT965_07730 [Clostridia bacterium]|nr:hypothetical protein [Clostridia bacterium]MDY2928737.1 hypothetical protein [Clostridiaceae bacterium]
MYEDLACVEKMVSRYLVLDKEDQEKIQQKVLELYVKSDHKETIFDEQSRSSRGRRLSDEEIEEEINERTVERLTKASELAGAVHKFHPDQRAAILIALAGFRKKEPKVHITISSQQEPTQQWIEELIPEADYENARRIYREMFDKGRRDRENLD